MMSAPGLSVICIGSGASGQRERDRLRCWLQRQTCAPLLAGIVWDRDAGTAFPLNNPGSSWDAPDVPALLGILSSEYVCIASDDLFQQNETYLEENLIALKTGVLAFTVNVRGDAEWAVQKVRNAQFPGSRTQPLLRQVVRKECVGHDLSLDLSGWIGARKGFASIAGRIIRHLTNQTDPPESIPFESRLACQDVQILVEGASILVRIRDSGEWKPTFGKVHPVETMPPETPPEGDLPLAIMIHTYLAVGGAERLHLNLMRQLHDTIRFVVVGIEPLDPALGTTADEFRRLTPYVYTLPDFLPPSMNLSFLCGLIDRFRPAALYIANGANFVYDFLLEIRHRYPKLRMSNQVYDHKIGWINRYNPAIAASLDAHIGANQRICQAYMEKGAPAAEVFLVEHGIIPEDFDVAPYNPQTVASIKERLSLPLDKRIVTFAARLHEHKRPLDFVDLAETCRPDPSLAFLMVGDGPLAEAVSQRIAEKGLRNIYRRPFYQPMRDIFAVTDVYVLPSSFEGMPMVLMEAQVMGKPVVVTDVGNNREMINFTGGGVVISQVGDIQALMAGVQRMLHHPPDPHVLRQTVLSRYDIALVAEQYRRVLMGLPGPGKCHA